MDCSLSTSPSGAVEILEGQGYRPSSRGPKIFVYELPPEFNVKCVASLPYWPLFKWHSNNQHLVMRCLCCSSLLLLLLLLYQAHQCGNSPHTILRSGSRRCIRMAADRCFPKRLTLTSNDVASCCPRRDIHKIDRPPLHLALHERILTAGLRTTNGDEADYFYLPITRCG